LGKGIGALIQQQDISEEFENANLLEIDPKLIKANPYQPRLSFDPIALEELKKSIEENGLIQPIAVRKEENGDYELIAGERRLRSVIELGFDKIPAFILDISSKEAMLEIALIENVQREHLNMIEQALSYQRLVDECQLTIEQVAQKIGKERSTVNNIIRLLKLPKRIQNALENNNISAGHARSLLGLSDADEQLILFEKILKKDLSVRQVEKIVKESRDEKKNGKKSKKIEKLPFHNQFEDKLRSSLGTKVQIQPKKKGGSIEIEYYSDDDLTRLSELFEKL
jgi:ParB family chromosome partitioning protein